VKPIIRFATDVAEPELTAVNVDGKCGMKNGKDDLSKNRCAYNNLKTVSSTLVLNDYNLRVFIHICIV
jgi:hypothetical protein